MVYRCCRVRSYSAIALCAGLFAALMLGLVPLQARGGDRTEAVVYGLIAERLSLMKPIAEWKHARGVAIEDLEREAVVLDRAVEDALAAGLDGDSARQFFQAQIAAAKDIQGCWFAAWEAGSATPASETPDLQTEIRPKLLEIGADLLTALGESLRAGVSFDGEAKAAFSEAVAIACLSEPKREAIFDRLAALRLKES